MILEVLGLPKLSPCVLVLGRLPICVFSAPEIVFTGAGLAEAEHFGHHPWQTAYLRFLCPKIVFTSAGLAEAEHLYPHPWQTAYLRFLGPPKIVFRGAGVAEAEYLCPRPWQTAYLFSLLPKLFLQVLGLSTLSICVVVLG